jgi:hypothetical protein
VLEAYVRGYARAAMLEQEAHVRREGAKYGKKYSERKHSEMKRVWQQLEGPPSEALPHR